MPDTSVFAVMKLWAMGIITIVIYDLLILQTPLAKATYK